MNGFLLDTNVPSELIRPRPEPKVQAWVASRSLNELYLSVVTLGELRKGIALRAPGKRRIELEEWLETNLLTRFSDRILPVTQAIANDWGILDAKRQHRGTPLETADGLTAATALEHNLTLVTRNVKDFASLGGTLLNPWQTS